QVGVGPGGQRRSEPPPDESRRDGRTDAEESRLSEELPREPPSTGTQRRTNAHLRGSECRPTEKEVGEVEACGEQHQATDDQERAEKTRRRLPTSNALVRRLLHGDRVRVLHERSERRELRQ